MVNPITAMLNAQSLAKSLKTGNPEVMFNQLMNSNPQFKAFVEANKDKTPEQIAQENGIDINVIMSLIR